MMIDEWAGPANAGAVPALHTGWYLAGMLDEFAAPVTPLRIGNRRLIVVAGRDDEPRIYDAVCPHRGADLGVGGTLTRAGIVCPFHGKAVALGSRPGARYSTPELPSFLAGPALFVALDAAQVDDRGFRAAMTALAAGHALSACPPVDMAVPQQLVIENAFDLDHFIQVHLIPKVSALDFGRTPAGAAYCEALFQVRPPGAAGTPGRLFDSRFHATAFSPSLVVSELGVPGSGPTVVTSAVPTPTGCRVRVSTVLVDKLTEGAAKALAQDAPIWDNLDLEMVPDFDPRDEPVLLFREFCREFTAKAADRVLC
jgi:3-ketosteroid 9alpha-monooxygenase subunit A